MNNEVKQAMKSRGVKQWAVAKEIGVSEATMVRWLRDILPDERRMAIFAAIDKLSEQK